MPRSYACTVLIERTRYFIGIPAVILAALTAYAIGAARPAEAGWAGRNGPIVFAGGDARSGSGLWAKRLGVRGLRQLTTEGTDSQPQSSPDGRSIAFVRQVEVPLPGGGGGTFPATHVFRARSNGAQAAPVTSGPFFDSAPAFAPSAERIVFSRFQPGASQADIWSIRLDGTNLHQLTSGPGDDRNPVFSPNRRLIAFDRFERGGTRHVHTMRPDGSRIVDPTPRLAAQTAQADFNPAGNRIVFIRGFPGDPGADLFTMRPDGERMRRLTGMRRRERGGFSNPTFSPDGRRVVAQFEADFGFSRLQVIRLRDRSWGATLGGRRMARSPDMRAPVWQAR
jgi:Tol biopolymer transport system component